MALLAALGTRCQEPHGSAIARPALRGVIMIGIGATNLGVTQESVSKCVHQNTEESSNIDRNQ